MTSASDILDTLRSHHAKLSALGVTRIGIFGSFARGEARPSSDLDVLVELDERTFDRYMDVRIYLEDLFGMRVDLVLADRIKPALRERILAEVVHAA